MKSRTRLPSYKALSYLSKDQSVKKVLQKKNTTLLLDVPKPPANSSFNYDPKNKENNINLMNIEVNQRKIGSKSLISERQRIKSQLKKESILLPLASTLEAKEVAVIPKESQEKNESKFPSGLSIYYHQIIYHLLKMSNSNPKIDPSFMEKQKQVKPEKRQELISELVQLHEKFKMLPTTLFKAVNILDRYLNQNTDIERRKFELLGLTALHSAAKFEQIYPPSMRRFIEAASYKFFAADFVSMEGGILKQLDFNLCDHTTCQFIDTMAIQFEFTEKERLLCQYLAELALYSSKLSHYQAIEQAIGIAVLVKPDVEVLVLSAFDKEGDERIEECSGMIHKLWKKTVESGNGSPTKKKYSQGSYLEVGKMTSLNQ